MEIRNVTQFADFLSSSRLREKDTIFTQTVNCVNNYRAACNCYKKEDKITLYNQCNKLYGDAVKFIIPKFKNEILSKIPDRQISFYDEGGHLLMIVSR